MDQEPVRIVLRASRLIDGTGAAPTDDPMLVIQDGSIEAVCCGELPAPLARGARLVELPGKTILPGLIDAHIHLTFEGAEPAGGCPAVGEDDCYLALRALNRAQALLRCGITTARDCGDRRGISFAVRRAIAEGLAAGPRLVCCGPAITTTGGHFWPCGVEADTADDLRRAVRAAVKQGADAIKVIATGGPATPRSNSRRAQFSAAELRAVVAEAHRLGRRVAAHCLGTEGIAAAVEAGVDTIEHCAWLGAEEGCPPDFQAGLAREMARKGIYWTHTVDAGWRAMWPTAEPSREALPEQASALAAAMAPFVQTRQAGARMVIASDAGARGTPFAGFVDALETACLGMGVPPLAAIESCTRVAAEALGLAREIGTLVPGRRADVLVVEGDPSADISVLRRVACVLRDGRVVHRNEE